MFKHFLTWRQASEDVIFIRGISSYLCRADKREVGESQWSRSLLMTRRPQERERDSVAGAKVTTRARC